MAKKTSHKAPRSQVYRLRVQIGNALKSAKLALRVSGNGIVALGIGVATLVVGYFLPDIANDFLGKLLDYGNIVCIFAQSCLQAASYFFL